MKKRFWFYLLLLALTMRANAQTVVQATAAFCDSCSSLTLPYVSNNGSGHTLLTYVGFRGGLNGAITVTDSNNSYTLDNHFGIAQGAGQFIALDSFHLCNSNAGANSVTANAGIFTETNILLAIVEVSGLSTSGCLLDNDTTNTGTCTGGCGATVTTRTVVTTQTNEFMISPVWEETLTTLPSSSPYTTTITSVVNTGSSQTSILMITSHLAPTISTNTNTFTFSGGTGSYISRNVAFGTVRTFGRKSGQVRIF